MTPTITYDLAFVVEYLIGGYGGSTLQVSNKFTREM